MTEKMPDKKRKYSFQKELIKIMDNPYAVDALFSFIKQPTENEIAKWIEKWVDIKSETILWVRQNHISIKKSDLAHHIKESMKRRSKCQIR